MDKAKTPKELAIAEYRIYLRIKNELHEVARRFLCDIRSKHQNVLRKRTELLC